MFISITKGSSQGMTKNEKQKVYLFLRNLTLFIIFIRFNLHTGKKTIRVRK